MGCGDSGDTGDCQERHIENGLFGVENAIGDAGDGGDAEMPPCSAGDVPEPLYDPETGEVVGTWER